LPSEKIRDYNQERGKKKPNPSKQTNKIPHKKSKKKEMNSNCIFSGIVASDY